ncbi:MAG: hypothetical protein EOP84_25060 [Verrucomicrobiaceae bacterium]|nr:MAG: hypothetical protein EOP84_25060 [Verrucomicrobiaceae bacterium]
MIRTSCIFALAGSLLACLASPSLAAKEAAVVFASSRNKDVVSDCLMNRLISDHRNGKIERNGTENIVTFYNFLGTFLVFNIRDDGTGSIGEMQRLMRSTPGRTIALTCFDREISALDKR